MPQASTISATKDLAEAVAPGVGSGLIDIGSVIDLGVDCFTLIGSSFDADLLESLLRETRRLEVHEGMGWRESDGPTDTIAESREQTPIFHGKRS